MLRSRGRISVALVFISCWAGKAYAQAPAPGSDAPWPEIRPATEPAPPAPAADSAGEPVASPHGGPAEPAPIPPAPNPTASSASVAAPAAGAADGGAAPAARAARCSAGEQTGVDPASAATATAIVCGELAEQHPRAGRNYRVGFGKLGRVLIFSLTEETATGEVTTHRQLALSSIEEIPLAAPRMVEAVLQDRPIEDTETVDSVVGDTTRAPKKRVGGTAFRLGSVGLLADAGGIKSSVGLDLAAAYQTARVDIGYALRFAAVAADDGVGMFATGPYLRWFFSAADIAPFAGGGMGPMMLTFRDPDASGDTWGLGLWGEAGVEVMRTHRSHLSLGGRLDVPAFALDVTRDDAGDATTSVAPRSIYVLPLEVFAAFTFD